jgi:hypothetical protein
MINKCTSKETIEKFESVDIFRNEAEELKLRNKHLEEENRRLKELPKNAK